MQVQNPPELRGPQRRKLLRIPLGPWEARGLPKALREVALTREDAPPVIVLPGLWASDRTMWALRLYLRRAGYDAQGWGLGRNFAGRELKASIADLPPHWNRSARIAPDRGEARVPALCLKFGEALRARSEALGRPIALVGWSLGGYVAREAARDHPEHVSAVITLGSPLVGGPKYTVVNGRYRRKGLDVDWIDEETRLRHETPIRCPVLSIYSKHDAIVHWSASIDRWTPHAQHHEVDCTHTAFAFHAPTFGRVHAELDRIGIR